MEEKPKRRWFRFPFLVAGAIVGACFMQTWPGQNEFGMFREMIKCVGGGVLIGAIIERLYLRGREAAP